MKKTAMYPGSFDPITLGHLDLIRRARRMFERVIVAVVANPQKEPLFSAEERVALCRAAIRGLSGVEVVSFDGLLVNYLRRRKCRILLRGLRFVSDLEYELQMALTNRQLYPEVETVFLLPDERYANISSTLVKEVARLGGDISRFVPGPAAAALRRKIPA